jgi:hypothetical protein
VPGFRRFGLHPARHLRQTLARALGIAIAIGVVIAAVAFALGRGAPSDSGGTRVVMGLVLVFLYFLVSPYVRRTLAAGPTYELLVGPRVLRRTVGGLGPAEVLRPEVTRIVDAWVGLVVVCEGPAQALIVARTVEGYDDVRSELATWSPIQQSPGWRILLTRPAIFGKWPSFALRECDAEGPALAQDATLREELELARQLSSEAHLDYEEPRERPLSASQRALRTILVAVAAVVALVIWTALNPSAPPSKGAPPTSTSARPQ